MQEETVTAAVDWLIQSAFAGRSEAELLQGICERFVAGGIPLKRVAAGSGLLHPTIDSRGFRWVRGEPVQREEYFHDRVSLDDWEKSPFRTLVEGNENSMRRRLEGDYRIGEYELLDTLKADGSTDYYALIHRNGDPEISGKVGSLVSSWTIDRPGGYSDLEIAQIERVAWAFALSYQSRSLHGTIRTLLETYLGRGAAQRVLLGNINRGQADAIESIIWYSDLQHFTRIADEVEREHLLSFLNEYAACLVESIEAHDGEVLKFIGDGILAIFAHDDTGISCSNALNAAMRAEAKIAALNEQRLAKGQRTTDFYLALHCGDLLFGNFGSTNRLDFTVLGPAVNEASRIGGMCRSLDQRVIVSSAFAEGAGPRRRDLVSLGRYALRGVGQPQELFTIDRSARRTS
jgi:adenylate cyclase